MNGWGVFWICLCILIASPSMSSVAYRISELNATLKETNKILKSKFD